MGDPAGELDDLLAAADLTQRVGDHLAVLGGQDLRQLTLALVEQLAELEQHLRALGQRRIPPPRKRRDSGINHRTRIGHTGQSHLTGHLTRRRIRHRRRLTAVAREYLVVEPMRNRVTHSYFPYFETYSVMVLSW